MAGTGQGVYKSVDDGDNWTNINDGLIYNDYITALAAHPTNYQFLQVPGGVVYFKACKNKEL